MIGELNTPMAIEDFLSHLKNQLQAAVVRHTRFVKPTVSKIALCGGSGSFLLKDAISLGADVFRNNFV